MLTRRKSALALVLATLAFACEQGNRREARELVALYDHVSEAVTNMEPAEGAMLFLVGTGIKAPVPRSKEDLVIVGQLTRDVPEAGAKAGDRVAFRPNHPDLARQCVVMRSAQAEQFLGVIGDGTLEIIATSHSGGDDPRADLVQHLQGRLPHAS